MSELEAYRCRECGRVTYPGRFRCLNCKGREFDKVPVSGKCTLVTFSEIRNLPWGIDERERVLGVAQFDEGFRAMGWVRADDPGIGMVLQARVEPVRVIEGNEALGLVFRPIE
jgi:uncharacterized OB-fold protein